MADFRFREPFEYGHVHVEDEVVLVRYKRRDPYFVLKVRTCGPKGDHLDCFDRFMKRPERLVDLHLGELVVI